MKAENKDRKNPTSEVNEEELNGVTGGTFGTMQYQPGMQMGASTMEYRPGTGGMQAQTLENSFVPGSSNVSAQPGVTPAQKKPGNGAVHSI